MERPQTALFRPGQQIRYIACKADGQPYRWNTAWVREVRPDCIILDLPAGVITEGPKYGKPTKYRTRHYLWLGRPYNLFECYEPDGTPRYLYVNIGSAPILAEGEIRYVDYELDLVKRYGETKIYVIDEDEFAEAITQYGYTPSFQAECWAAVAQARALLETWTWHPAGAPPLYQPGQSVQMTALKADGQPYRWANLTVLTADANYVVLTSPVGTPIEGPKGGWKALYEGHVHLWSDRPYNLTEVFYADGTLLELYVNIASHAEFLPGEIRYIDYELDVSKKPGRPAEVVDEEEFQEAIPHYGYTEQLQKACYQAVQEVLELVETWPHNT